MAARLGVEERNTDCMLKGLETISESIFKVIVSLKKMYGKAARFIQSIVVTKIVEKSFSIYT